MAAFYRCAGAVALSLVLAGFARAEMINPDFEDRGCYSHSSVNSGYHNPYSESYFAGRITEKIKPTVFEPVEYRNFFVFDLSKFTKDDFDLIHTASLELNVISMVGDNLNFQLYGIENTTIESLVAGGNNKQSIFDDLKDGMVYGGREIHTSDLTVNQGYVNIPLNADFLSAAKNAAGSMIALGGAVIDLPPNTGDRYLFCYDDIGDPPFTSKLIFIPEPGSFSLLLFGATFTFAFAFTRSRRRKM